MKKNKVIVILFVILIVLISIIILLSVSINKRNKFIRPNFDKKVSVIPKEIDYESSVIEIRKGYSIYINSVPTVKDNELAVNFVSMDENDIWIKIRILDNNKQIIGESGLVKPGEFLESVKLNRKLKSKEDIIYEIIGYEIDSYLSAGTIRLNTKVGA